MTSINLDELTRFARLMEQALERGDRIPEIKGTEERKKFAMLGSVATPEETPLLRRWLDKMILED